MTLDRQTYSIYEKVEKKNCEAMIFHNLPS